LFGLFVRDVVSFVEAKRFQINLSGVGVSQGSDYILTEGEGKIFGECYSAGFRLGEDIVVRVAWRYCCSCCCCSYLNLVLVLLVFSFLSSDINANIAARL
jgi:hypothetical protein